MRLYRISPDSEKDWREIVRYTRDHFGEAQARKYTNGLLHCIEAMARGEGYYKDVQVSQETIRMKHCQKHYIFAIIEHERPITVIAILHEKMELMKRLQRRLPR